LSEFLLKLFDQEFDIFQVYSKQELLMSKWWIKTDSLYRIYRRGPQEIRAVDGVNLNINRGEFLGVVGSSGSGKSTLLNLLAGLDTPSAGDVIIDGTPLGEMNKKQKAEYRSKRVGMVFQSFNLVQHRTALQNVELALVFANTPNRLRKKLATEVLESLGLGDRLNHRPIDLSGGEMQRVALARALVTKPDIIFADEPTGNLDRDNTIKIAKLLTELNQKNITIIMVTHDMGLAGKYCDRIVHMQYGRIVPTPEIDLTGGI